MLKKTLAALALAFVSAVSMAAVEANKGSVADLDGLPGVGPALSKRIIDARQHSEFKDWADLMARVKGIKHKAAAKLSAAGMTVNGKSFEATGDEPAPKKRVAAGKAKP